MNLCKLILCVVLPMVGDFLCIRDGSAQISAHQGFIDLTVPANAKVVIYGYLTKSTGARRSFYAIDMELGRKYLNRIVVDAVINSQPVHWEGSVSLRGGSTKTLTCNLP
jgi:uncharacterized protein (TIGR03000 family)